MAFNKPKVMDAARRAVEKGQTDRAIKEYLKVVREDPKDVRVWLKLGDLYAKRGAKQDATDTYLKVAKFYSEQGFNRKAVAVYKQILKLDPRLVEVNLKLAELYRQLGLLSEAMQHFEMVAAFFHREGKTQEALATIRQLVDLDPENVATRIKLAELYSKEGMVDEAVVELTGACDYLKRNNRHDDYVKVAERLLWHKPDNAPLCRELANLYLRKNDPRRALQKLQICFKASPRDVETLALLAQAFQSLDQKGKAVSVLKELAKVLAENSQRSEAAEVHQKILAYVPDDPDSLAFLGRAGSAASQAPQSALGSGQMAAASSSMSLSASDIGLSQVSGSPSDIGRTTGSVPLVDPPDPEPLVAEVLESSPGDGRIGSISGEVHAEEIIKILTETEVYVKYGLHQKAIDHLKRIFELDPGNVEAHEQLKDIYLSQGSEREAISELISLARRTGISEPQRAEGYLREVMELDPGSAEASQVARELGLQLDGAATADAIGLSHADLAELDIGIESTGEIGLADDDIIELDLDDDQAPAPDPTGTQEVEIEQVEESVPVLSLDDALDTPPAEELDFDSHNHMPAARESMQTLDELPRPHNAAQSSGSLPAIAGGAARLEEADDSASLIPADDSASLIPAADSGGVGSALEDDLDEADFFMSQGLVDEARDILTALSSRYPNHPLVMSKLQELGEHAGDAADMTAADSAPEIDVPDDPLADLAADVESALDFGSPMDGNHIGEAEPSKPAVLLERPVDEEDADTHYDLGLAYKEMGLYDEAIKSFSKVIASRGVQCYLMIGLCYREQQNLAEAISQFKAGLYVDTISEREKYSLYYEIGSSYQLLNDPQEALYFLEMVHKKDPGYRDVASRIATLRGSQGGGQAESYQ